MIPVDEARGGGRLTKPQSLILRPWLGAMEVTVSEAESSGDKDRERKGKVDWQDGESIGDHWLSGGVVSS